MGFAYCTLSFRYSCGYIPNLPDHWSHRWPHLSYCHYDIQNNKAFLLPETIWSDEEKMMIEGRVINYVKYQIKDSV